eukprot:55708-Chlamydomonas_euryale.AAC.2
MASRAVLRLMPSITLPCSPAHYNPSRRVHRLECPSWVALQGHPGSRQTLRGPTATAAGRSACCQGFQILALHHSSAEPCAP